MFEFANPKRFMDLTGPALPWVGGASAILIAIGGYFALAVVPPERLQGDTVRIMYVHVPAAWVAMMAYGVMALASLFALVNRHPLADIAAREAAPLGALFTALALVTGSLWGKPTWGTFWVWDARLTSFLLLLFLYLGYIALWNAIDDEVRAGRAAAVLAIIGAVNLPIIVFSVEWWNTLHQGESIFRAGGPSIAPVFLWPLFAMAAGYTLLFLTLLVVRIRTAVMARAVRTRLVADAA
jgi:heme exporter protein C